MMLLTSPDNLPFTVAFCIMIGIAVIEGIGVFVAMSPSQLLDSWIPESSANLEGALGWLHVGRVPVLVLLVLFLAGFSSGGYLTQMSAHALSNAYLPAFIASIPGVLAGLGTVRGIGGIFARTIPRDESTAVSHMTLIGRAGIVIIGTARQGLAAETKVRDQHGISHYLMVEPDVPDETFEQGDEVLIVKKAGAVYRAIRNPHPIHL
jgi:hypothetical protein